MNQNQSQQTDENATLNDASFPADEPGLTTAFDKSDVTELTDGAPKGPHIVAQDEFWNDVKNADQTPREVASSVPTDMAEPQQTPEEERENNQ